MVHFGLQERLAGEALSLERKMKRLLETAGMDHNDLRLRLAQESAQVSSWLQAAVVLYLRSCAPTFYHCTPKRTISARST